LAPSAPSDGPRNSALPPSTWLRAVAHADRALALVTEIPAALLVLCEIVVLLCGVISRYALHRPLTWSDELASMMFLWLAMLGAVIAFRRSAHMRMTALVDMASPQTRAFLDLVGVVAAGTFLLLIGHQAFEFAAEEMIVTTPSLEISNVWRAAALPCGIALMGVAAALKLAEVTDWKRLAAAVALTAVAVVGLTAMRPMFQDLGNITC